MKGIFLSVLVLTAIVVIGCSTTAYSNSSQYDTLGCDYGSRDPSLRPLVWEYVGGHLGSLPNQPSIECALFESQFHTPFARFHQDVVTSAGPLKIYIREDDGYPMGLVAVVLPDG